MAGHHPDGDYAWKIANGRGAMPAWSGSLTENQIWDLVNFIQSLGGSRRSKNDNAEIHTAYVHRLLAKPACNNGEFLGRTRAQRPPGLLMLKMQFVS